MTSNSFESLLVIPAACAFFYNDVLALISILGSVILFLGSFPGFPFKRLIGLAEWNSAPLVFEDVLPGLLLSARHEPGNGRYGTACPDAAMAGQRSVCGVLLLMGGRWWRKSRNECAQILCRERRLSGLYRPAK
jgi:hypothetical protein